MASPNNWLLKFTEEPAGVNCEYDGYRIDVGSDTNFNGLLDQTEITQTGFICHGPYFAATYGEWIFQVRPVEEQLLVNGKRPLLFILFGKVQKKVSACFSLLGKYLFSFVNS